MIGFLLTPTVASACGMKSGKSCCKSGTSDKSEKDCCKKKSSKDKDKGCDGKCNHPSCSCPGYNSGLSLMEEKGNNLFGFSSERLDYSPIEDPLSSGFFSVWLPPKIG